MSILKSLRAGGVAMLLAASALTFAADTKAPAGPDAPADSTAKHSRGRLTKPWNELKDLTEDEKKQILAIHQKALDSIKAIQAQEHTDILAVLTDAQRKEVTDLIGKDKAAASEHRTKPTTRPAGATDAKTPDAK